MTHIKSISISLVTALGILLSTLSTGAEKVVSITATDAGNATSWEIHGNLKGEPESRLIKKLDVSERQFTVEVPDDCTPLYLFAYGCSETVCSKASNISEYKIECQKAQAPTLN